MPPPTLPRQWNSPFLLLAILVAAPVTNFASEVICSSGDHLAPEDGIVASPSAGRALPPVRAADFCSRVVGLIEAFGESSIITASTKSCARTTSTLEIIPL